VVNNFPEPTSKTGRIMEYLVSRGNEEIAVEIIASDLKIDQKMVASIASRLVSRGMITRTSRGIYVHKQLSVRSSTIEGILSRLEKTIRKTFGKQIAEKVNIALVRRRKDIEGLEEANARMRKILGVAGANNLFRLVAKKVARPSELKYILLRSGISD
jgi:predicted transcriptional regulator